MAASKAIKWDFKANEGYHLSGGQLPITLLHTAMHQEGVEFNDDQLKDFAKAILTYSLQVNSSGEALIKRLNMIDSAPVFSAKDFTPFVDRYIYKYVDDSAIDFYREGKFQLGNILYYQEIENEKARDELEGLAFINTKMINRVVNSTVTAGYNYYIFCATESPSQYHVDNFGANLMRFEVLPFATKIAKRVKAESFKIMKVNYANAKIYASRLDLDTTPERMSKLGGADSNLYINHLIAECADPCLFIKPGWFKDENEIRIVFEMPYNVNPIVPRRFENPSLLKHIEFR